MGTTKKLSAADQKKMLEILQHRFEKNRYRHKNILWHDVQQQLEAAPEKLGSLYEMENSGGEPDVVQSEADEIIFFDCAAESPAGRRSCCYDRAALDSRKEHKPKHSAMDMAAAMGAAILTEEQYRYLQQWGNFDGKTSSWIQTPEQIRELGGALFCDRRYDTVFVYHNGAESYYAARGFRCMLKI